MNPASDVQITLWVITRRMLDWVEGLLRGLRSDRLALYLHWLWSGGMTLDKSLNLLVCVSVNNTAGDNKPPLWSCWGDELWSGSLGAALWGWLPSLFLHLTLLNWRQYEYCYELCQKSKHIPISEMKTTVALFIIRILMEFRKHI